MTKKITRRGFIAGSGVAAASVALAGCSSDASEPTAEAETASSDDIYAAPDLSAYPIDPDGDDVEALFTTETMRKDKWTKATNPDGHPTIGVMDASRIIQVNGLAFRDMNGDGKLEAWEDWRQDADTRAAELAKTLTAEDCFPLMFAGGTQSDSTSTDTSAFDWIEAGSRAGVSRLASSADSYATDVEWINNVQQVCEESELGIPYFNYSDPYVLFNVPSSIGLACTMDKDIWRKAGMWQARAWRASGVRCELGPQVDVYSSNIGTRCSGSVCEDPALNRDFTAAFGGGMQSTWGDDEATEDLGWGDDSCGVMLKHYVGEGSNEGGRDDHCDGGKWDVFPGSNFKAHLIPFLDGGMNLDSSTGQMMSVMPCYGIAYDPNDDSLGEHVGGGYSTHNISILRNAGWDGFLCTDWLILEGTCHGLDNIPVSERMQRLMNNTISQHGGSFEPDVAKEAYDLMVAEVGEDEALAVFQDNARRALKAEILVDLFDQPYSDRDVAAAIMTSEAAEAFGEDAATKSVVMLKNDGTISEAGLDGTVYVPQKFTAAAAGMWASTPASIAPTFTATDGLDVVTDHVADPSGTDDDGNAVPQESDLTMLTADELKDVKYAIVGISSPADAYQGIEGGESFMDILAIENPVYDSEPEVTAWKPISLQYRPFTADGDYVREESLNPENEFGVYVNRSVKGQSTYATNESDLDLVISVKEKLPEGAKLICVVDANRPMIFSELEPYCDVILLGFGSIWEGAFNNIITGAAEPYGLLPFQMPADMQTVMEGYEDVPRDNTPYTDSAGNTYDFTFGLNWSGQIDDDRVATYNVPALTEPETEVVADA